MTQMTLEQALKFAIQRQQAGDSRQAESMYRQILSIEPNQPDALHMLGLLALQANRRDEALDLIERAVRVAPTHPGYHCNRGQVLAAMGRIDDSMAAYRQALALQPNLPEALNNLGNLLRDRGQMEEAINCHRQALSARPGAQELWLNLGMTLQAARRWQEAIDLYQQFLRQWPDHSDAWNDLGVLLQEVEQLQQAIEAYRKALSLRPTYAAALNNLGNALLESGQPDQAEAAFNQAVMLTPDSVDAHRGLGNAQQNAGRLDQAIASLQHAVKLAPDVAESHSDLGMAMHLTGQWSLAQSEFRRAIQLNPDCAHAHYNLSHALLLQGKFAEGWAEYEWRWRVKHRGPTRPNFAQPQWNGEELHGRRLLLHAEQGFGDAIQFARYAPLAAAKGATIILKCQSELTRLFRNLGGVDQIVGPDEEPGEFDLYCPLLSLPRAFGTIPQSIPGTIPYLKTDAELSSSWSKRLGGDGTMRIGLAWAGRPSHRNDRNRSLPFNALFPLASVADVRFFSLQKGSITPDTNSQLALTDFTGELKDFADTAALIDNLDLVITVDTAVAHLAGALGKPTWVLLPFVPDWRWLLDRDDSPWYPTMRLFRQPKADDWHTPISQVVLVLQELKRP